MVSRLVAAVGINFMCTLFELASIQTRAFMSQVLKRDEDAGVYRVWAAAPRRVEALDTR